MNQLCPCCSGKLFSECCEPIIRSGTAQTAEQLMRSRYSAYATGNAEYIFKTTHPEHQKTLKISAIKEWSEENSWERLAIVETVKGKGNDQSGIVEFKAFYRDSNGSQQIHHERSEFHKLDNRWYYTTHLPIQEQASGNTTISRNDPCPCGSGKKYKKCCG